MAVTTRGVARRTTVITCALTLTTLAACSGDDSASDGGSAGGGEAITVWIQEDLPDRVEATKAIVADFTAATDIPVELIPVAEDQFNQLITTSAAAGDLPDVIGGVSLAQVRTLATNELLDPEAASAVVDELGADTFSESALTLTSDEDAQLAVPSESWTQLLIYRKDLFDQAGLEAPTTYEAITAAAEELDGPDLAGFVGANSAGDAFTEQTFEHAALGNGCQMVNDSEEITFDSSQCVEALDFYGNLIENYSVPGGQDVDTTRASYFAGQASMIIWSTFILDELAGLRDDAKPNCAQCTDDPGWLAKNSGVVTSISGPSSDEPAVFGEITSWLVTADSATDPASQFITYMMTDGYMPWIAIAPEGKVPVRAGTAENPTEFADAWADLEVGVDTKAPLSDFYGQDVTEALTTGAAELDRWAIPQGQGALLGALQGELPVATAVNKVSNGADPQEVAESTAEAIRTIQESLP